MNTQNVLIFNYKNFKVPTEDDIFMGLHFPKEIFHAIISKPNKPYGPTCHCCLKYPLKYLFT